MTPELLELEYRKLNLAIVATALTAIAAGIAGWIAYRQSRTAAKKLRFDLYEKRFAIYQAAIAMMRSFTETETENPAYSYIESVHSKFLDARAEADFLLEAPQQQYLQLIYDVGYEGWEAAGEIRALVSEYGIENIHIVKLSESQNARYDKAYKKLEEVSERFQEEMNDAPKVFMPFLDFKKVL